MEKHTDTNATRQRNFRLDAAKEFGVKPWTILVTEPEKAFILRALKREFGHVASMASRRQVAVKNKRLGAEAAGKGSGPGQMEQTNLL
jgi:hypothetical protein